MGPNIIWLTLCRTLLASRQLMLCPVCYVIIRLLESLRKCQCFHHLFNHWWWSIIFCCNRISRIIAISSTFAYSLSALPNVEICSRLSVFCYVYFKYIMYEFTSIYSQQVLFCVILCTGYYPNNLHIYLEHFFKITYGTLFWCKVLILQIEQLEHALKWALPNFFL